MDYIPIWRDDLDRSRSSSQIQERNSRCLREASARCHWRWEETIHSERRARCCLVYLHAGAQGVGGEENHPRALPLREPGPGGCPLSCCKIQCPVGWSQVRAMVRFSRAQFMNLWQEEGGRLIIITVMSVLIVGICSCRLLSPSFPRVHRGKNFRSSSHPLRCWMHFHGEKS